jgi:hypothetical protein
MRTVKYVLTGNPQNRPDCIDYSKHHELRRISVELHTHEDLNESLISRVFYATYVWVFDDRVVTYQETYGRCFQHESVSRQRESIDNANIRLERSLSSLKDRVGIDAIEGEDQRFDRNLVYGKRQAEE